MERASYEKILMEDPAFPVWVLENEKNTPQQLCPLHWHEHLELHYILQGALELRIGQSTHTLRPGDLAVINGNEAHSSLCPGRLKERILIFQPEALFPKFERSAFQRIIPQDPRIAAFFASFEAEYSQKQPGHEAACLGILLQLTAHLIRNYTLSPSSGMEYRQHTRQLQRFMPVTEYIALHYAEPISPETLAGLVFLSTDRFNHLFKETMGIPLRRYINDIRLHSARDWLEKGLCTPSEAAAQAGFTDYNHFGRLFRQAFGCPPSKTAK